jgi:hypothetical protein
LTDSETQVPNNYFAFPKHFDLDFAVPYNYCYNTNCKEAVNIQSAIIDLLYLNPHLSDASIKAPYVYFDSVTERYFLLE